jgi:hypothetical protein
MTDTQQYPAVADAEPDPQLNPRFDQTPDGGYHPGQVDGWISGIVGRLHTAEQHLTHFGQDAEQALVKAAESPAATKLVAELMQMAAKELADLRAEAEQAAAKLVSDARADAGQLLDQAREEAGRVAAGAREQADIALEGGRAEAKRMTDEAAAHSAAVSEDAARRLQDLEGRYAEARRRMQQYHDTTGKILDADAQRGTLSDGVRELLATAGHPALPATPAIAAVEAPDTDEGPVPQDEAPAGS